MRSDNHQVGMIAARALQQFVRSRPFQQAHTNLSIVVISGIPPQAHLQFLQITPCGIPPWLQTIATGKYVFLPRQGIGDFGLRA
jgi:hypothetical protein